MDAEAARRIDAPWWVPLFQFGIHVAVGTFIFVAIAGLSVGIHWINRLAVLDGWAALPLRCVEYAIFLADIILFLIFLFRSSFRLAKSIVSGEL